MKTFIKTISLIMFLLTSSHVYSEGSIQHASKASKSSAKTIYHSAAASAKVVGAVIAVPLIVVGNLDDISTATGNALLKNATGVSPDENPELVITKLTITADLAPQEAMKTKNRIE